jgi:hypothetical protein
VTEAWAKRKFKNDVITVMSIYGWQPWGILGSVEFWGAAIPYMLELGDWPAPQAPDDLHMCCWPLLEEALGMNGDPEDPAQTSNS